MFTTYVTRPQQIQAIKVTDDNYQQVADWITANLADHRGVQIIHPGTQGQGRPRITFHAHDAVRHTAYSAVSIPGVLTVAYLDDGAIYTSHDVDMFDATWMPADSIDDQ